MSSNDQFHLRTLRREWGLTQKEVASLLPKADRNRVSRIERGLVPPNAREILAYGLIFGSPAKASFPGFYAETVDMVMRGAYRLHKRAEHDGTPIGRRKLELTERMLARATGKANAPRV